MKTYQLETIKVRLKVKQPPGEKVDGIGAATAILRAIFNDLDADQEHFVMLVLDTANQIRGFKVLCSGAVDSTTVDARIVFRTALLMGAAAILVAHNHPSGNTKPSDQDIMLTEKLQKAARVLDIRFLDHIILGKGSRSLKSEGYV